MSSKNNTKKRHKTNVMKYPIPTIPTFHKFPKLPMELRLKIWTEACCTIRNVDLWAEEVEYTMRFGPPPKYWSGDEPESITIFRSHSQPPGVLGANKESRTEGLKHYELSFGVKENMGRKFTMCKPATIFINWKCDRICLMNPRVMYGGWAGSPGMELVSKCERKGLTSFAYNLQHDEQHIQFPAWVTQGLLFSKSIKEVVLFFGLGAQLCRPKEVASIMFMDAVHDNRNAQLSLLIKKNDLIIKMQEENVHRSIKVQHVAHNSDAIRITICKLAYPLVQWTEQQLEDEMYGYDSGDGYGYDSDMGYDSEDGSGPSGSLPSGDESGEDSGEGSGGDSNDQASEGD